MPAALGSICQKSFAACSLQPLCPFSLYCFAFAALSPCANDSPPRTIQGHSTLRTSRSFLQPSTNQALCRLTSEVEPVHSTRYGRQRPRSLGPHELPPLANSLSCFRITLRMSLQKSRDRCKADSTLRTPRAVPHPSTNWALCRLTSEVEGDPVQLTFRSRLSREKTTNTKNN